MRTPKLAIAANGAGDTLAALFLAHYLSTHEPGDALAAAASSLFGVLRRTVEAGSRELRIVEAQDEFVHPTQKFEAVRVG